MNVAVDYEKGKNCKAFFAVLDRQISIKNILGTLLMLVLMMSISIPVYAKDFVNEDIITLNNLILEGESITDTSSADAYVWITKVLSFNEKYTDSYEYVDIKKECESAKGYTNISTFNTLNKILGYLNNLKDELNDTELRSIEELIKDGTMLADEASPSAYKWIIDVIKTNEGYMDSFVYSDIKKECLSAKGYSSISTFNTLNKILGYLNNVKDEIDNVSSITVGELIDNGNNITDTASANAYKWIVDVLKVNERYVTSSVYSDIKKECESAKGYSNISTFNTNSIIIAYLIILKDEAPISSVLQSISIATPPIKVEYVEGETFESSGLRINAIYLNTYTDGMTDTEIKEVTGFVTDTTTNLKCDDISWLISYTEGDITKTTTQDIIVRPYLVKETLDSIAITTPPIKTVYKEGESFNKAGMKISATYNRIWSDGTEDKGIKENVAFTVDTTTKLSAYDDYVVVTVTDNGITMTVMQSITVESYIISTTLDSITIVSYPIKVLYKEGEKFDKQGLVLSASYKNEWSNGYIEYTVQNNIAYSVNVTSPLKITDTKWTVSFIDKGIRKSIDIPITVVANDSVTEQETPESYTQNEKPSVGKVKSFKVKGGKKQLVLSWKKDAGIAGYQVQISTKKNFKGTKLINISKSKKTYTKKNLKSKKKYFVRIRAYKTYKNVSGETHEVYGKWVTTSKKTK